MSTILAIDTSSQACSVALTRAGSLCEKYEVLHRQHTARILPMIKLLLEEQNVELSQLEAIAFGSFEGSGILYRPAYRHRRGTGTGICPGYSAYSHIHPGGHGADGAS